MCSLHPADAAYKGFGTIPTSILQRKNGVCIYERPACRVTFAVRFFYTLMATIPCFYGIILQIGLKWNTPLFGQLVRLSALCMPADTLLGSCAAAEYTL